MKTFTFILFLIISAPSFSQSLPHYEFHKHRIGHKDRAEQRTDERATFTFEPMMAWTYQHASKVLPGSPHAKAILYYDVGGTWTVWNDSEGLGQFVYGIQGNVAGGTPSSPSLSSSLGNPMAMNNILTSEKLELASLYWQQSFSNHKTRLRVGKFLDASFFDQNTIASDSVSGFLAQNFNQSITNPMPDYGFGINVAWDVTEKSVLRFGIANSEPKGVRTTGFGGMSWGHLFSIAEYDITSNQKIGGVDRVGHYRFMVWHNGAENSAGTGDTNGWGLLFNCDQQISDAMTIFARIGGGEEDVTPSNFSVSTGFQVNDPFGFTNMTTGLAYQYAELSNGNNHQNLVEWFARIKMENGLNVGPVLQYFEDDAIDGSFVLGFRTSLSF
ncbi:MAG: carbohydrate porin [Phycisphaerales bacterium]|jgi:hypothetical protein|nr:carbohydrate porin [Phycisphaerales bacterium]